MVDEELKAVRSVGSSQKGSADLPARGEAGCWLRSLCRAEGRNRFDDQALKGFGGHAVLEIVTPFDGNTWRTVYTVRMRDVVYVLHASRKKSKSGISTPKAEIDLIHQRLAAAERHLKERQS